MKTKICLVLVICLVILAIHAFESSADQREYSHLHLRGRVATPDGQPVEGAVAAMRMPRGWVGSINTWSETRIENRPATNQNGEFHIILSGGEMTAERIEAVEEVDLTWQKEGYTIEPR